MQNISFIAIVGVLLGCAFFFSQLTKVEQREVPSAVTPSMLPETVADVPDCDLDLPNDELLQCLQDAAEVSDRLVELAADRIRTMEADPENRIAFVDAQITWAESRNADCEFLTIMADDDDQAAISEAACLRDRNLQRLEQLETLYCDWYLSEDCTPTDAPED